MTPTEAAKILDLPSDATPEQLEARFQELRTRLEEKIGKAPTPGLKAKYRESLDEITLAFETLTLAADSSALPVLRKSESSMISSQPSASGGGTASARAASPALSSPTPSPAPRRKAGGSREFAVVALIAILVLAGGGWFVMKTRAENAEKARIAAEAKAEADHQAELKRLAEQKEKERLAAEALTQQQAAAAEKERQESLFAQLRAQQAAEKIRWDTLEQELSLADRRLSELKSDNRNTRDLPSAKVAELKAEFAAQGDYVDWLRPFISRHPVRTDLAKFDALLSARAVDDAAKLAKEITAGITALETELATQKRVLLTLTGLVQITSNPEGLSLSYEDAYGRSGKGTTPFNGELPLGAATFRISRPGWSDSILKDQVVRGRPLTLVAEFPTATVAVRSNPSGLAFTLGNATGFTKTGTTPAEMPDLPPGQYSLRISRAGWPDQTTSLIALSGGHLTSHLNFTPGKVIFASEPSGATVYLRGQQLGVTPFTLNEVIPGTYSYEFRADRYKPSSIYSLVEFGKALDVRATLTKIIPTEEEIINEFTAKAAGVWKAKVPNSPGTSWLKVTAGSALTDGKGKALLITMRSQGLLKVSNRESEEILLLAKDPAAQRINEQSGSVSKISWEDGHVVITNQFVRLDFERVPDSEW